MLKLEDDGYCDTDGRKNWKQWWYR